MVDVTVAAAGVQGPRGGGWLSGVGVPASNLTGSIDGDFYLDTTNVGFYYGPRTNGLWGGAHPFGNSLNGVPLTNVTATTAPGVGNDTTQGYSRGSVWINTTNNLVYTCTNAATGAAVWQQAMPAGAPNGTLTVTNTPVAGQALIATSTTSAAWTTGAALSTGLISGGAMTQASSTQFNVATGYAQILDYVTTPGSPTVAKFQIPAQTVTLSGPQLARNINWWTSDANGVITGQASQPTADQRRSSVQLGVTFCTGGVISLVVSDPIYSSQPINQLMDLIYGLGPFSLSGNQLVGNASNLQFNKTAGTMFSASGGYAADPNNLHSVANPAETPCSFFYVTQLTNSSAAATAINPTVYDNAGVITTIPGGVNQSTVQRVFISATGISGFQITVQYGNTIYSSLAAAQAGIGAGPFVKDPDLSLSPLLAWIAISKSCTNLADTSTCTIITANKFATP